MHQSRAQQSRADHRRVEQSTAEMSTAQQSRADTQLTLYAPVLHAAAAGAACTWLQLLLPACMLALTAPVLPVEQPASTRHQ